jgi:3-hydroxymyristoyl/3-hydroxydecanoyl-(acyl carrier protein) dehydratase
MRFLFVDQITALSPGQNTKGIKHITRDDYYLRQDKTGAWSFVPSLVGETLGQLAAWNVMMSHDFKLRPVAGIAASATFYRPAYVGETLCLEAHIDVIDESAVQYHGDVHVKGELVFRLEGALGPLLPMNDFIDEAVVRQQFTEIYRPRDAIEHEDYSHDQLLHDASPITYTPKMTFDRVVLRQEGVSWTAIKHVTRAAIYFEDHFPKKPVLPMTVLLECFVNLADAFVTSLSRDGVYVCQKVRRIKMSDFISPGDTVVGSIALKHDTSDEIVFLGRAEVAGKRVGVLEITMALKGAVA